MKLAFCNEMFGDAGSDEVFAECAALGYTGVEIAPFTLGPGLSPFNIRQVPPASIAAMAGAAQKAGLEVVGLHWLFAKTQGLHLTSADSVTQQATSAYLVALAECCTELGGKILVLGSPKQRHVPDGMTHLEAEAAATQVIESAMPRFEALGVTLAIEPLGPAETDFVNTAESAMAICNNVRSPNCRLHLDVKAMATEGVSIPKVIRQHGAHLAHFHANDPNLLGPGMGDVDFVPILQALDEARYEGWISVEVFRYEPNAMEIARRSIEYLQAVR